MTVYLLLLGYGEVPAWGVRSVKPVLRYFSLFDRAIGQADVLLQIWEGLNEHLKIDTAGVLLIVLLIGLFQAAAAARMTPSPLTYRPKRERPPST